MSLQNQIVQNCPHCQHSQELFFYKSVNITVDPSLKQLVLDGKLNAQLCSNCEKEINIVTDFLYHNMEQRIMLHLKENVDTDELNDFERFQDFKDRGYIYRHVQTYPELIEKIKIFDAGLNDLVVDSIKAELSEILMSSLQEVITEDTEELELNLFFDTYEKSLFKKRLLFVFFLHPSQMMQTSFSLKSFDKTKRKELFNLEALRMQSHV
ncbi:CpXC protein [Kordia sp. SMS9]|uniref:CpXC domain-containing protein n=1 Tax=Kordia sp. SMS9 TaxID=2282170 RepID=UPI000E0DE76D|nr:CpXC domain-containing protein [Kordia sp. SMS9]AXG72122.1 CpXC protein [Kordia sp. SMS9]